MYAFLNHSSLWFKCTKQIPPPPKADTKLYDIITVELMLSFIDDINGQQGRSSIFIYYDTGVELDPLI